MSRTEQHRERRRWNQLVLALSGLLILTATFALPAAADNVVPSNLDLMDDLTSEVVDELIERFSKELSGHSVRLQPNVNNEQYQFMTNVFTRALTQRGIKTYQPGGSATLAPDAVILKYQATSFHLSYPKVYRSYLIGGKRVRRRADVTLLATLVADSSGAVTGVGEASRDHEDQFGYGELQRVEEGNYTFTRPPLPDSGWGKYAEPVLVTGIIVGLIYLFFSNQSDS